MVTPHTQQPLSSANLIVPCNERANSARSGSVTRQQVSGSAVGQVGGLGCGRNAPPRRAKLEGRGQARGEVRSAHLFLPPPLVAAERESVL
jgi:hypothetical protein